MKALLTGTGSLCGLAAATVPLRRPLSPGFSPGFGDLLAGGACWLLLGCAAWSMLICAAALLERWSAGRLRATSWVGCPAALRQVLLAGVGVALVSAPAHASMPLPGSAGSLPVPARPLGQAPSAAEAQVVVRAGDTLWGLAETRLRPTAPTGEVVDLVVRLHRRNRHVIGPDPDLIRPGQRLVLPAVPRPERRRHTEENP